MRTGTKPTKTTKMGEQRLLQYQCDKEGTLFYYQSGMIRLPFRLRCPVCGSIRCSPTGREFPGLDENSPLPVPVAV